MARRLQTYIKEESDRIKLLHARNWRIFKEQPWQELSGAFGDLGTFVPIFVALAASPDDALISVSSTLVFSGIANILTGIFFGIPLPVQPMKAIAAVAIANMGTQHRFVAGELASAGLFVAGCVALLSITGLLQVFTRAIPVPVVKGIQAGAGITLAMKSIVMVLPNLPHFATEWTNVIFGALALILLLYVASFPRFPFALVVVSAFAVLAIISGLVDSICPEYIGARCRFARMTSWIAGFVAPLQQFT